MSFRQFLNEIKARERNKVLFSLPTDMHKKENKLLSKKMFGYEVLECIRYFIDHHPDKFVLEDRIDNRNALNDISVPFIRSKYMPIIVDEILPYVKPEHFNKDKVERLSKSERRANSDTNKDECYAYIFVIKNPHLIFPVLQNYVFEELYLKFDFLYYRKKDPKSMEDRYISLHKNRYGDLVIEPNALTLSEISFHF